MESTEKEILRQLIEAKERGEEAPKMLRSLTVHIQGGVSRFLCLARVYG